VSRSETGAGFTESSKQSCSHQDGEPLGVVPNAVQSVSQDTGDSTADERCFEAGIGPYAVPCIARSKHLWLRVWRFRPWPGHDISQSSTANDLKVYQQHPAGSCPEVDMIYRRTQDWDMAYLGVSLQQLATTAWTAFASSMRRMQHVTCKAVM